MKKDGLTNKEYKILDKVLDEIYSKKDYNLDCGDCVYKFERGVYCVGCLYEEKNPIK